MTITEPMTMVTDYMITALGVWVGFRLLKRKDADRAVRFWAGALLATGVAALAGGTFHGFQTSIGPVAAAVSWRLTMIAIGAASFCFASAIAFSTLGRRVRNVIVALAVVKLAYYLVWITRHSEFKVAIYDYAPTMVLVLIVQAYVWMKRRDRAAAWIIWGIVISFLGAFIQMQEIGIHRHFNHNDIYHVVQMVGIYCFYRGGLLMHERR
jgi:hypothetical protein